MSDHATRRTFLHQSTAAVAGLGLVLVGLGGLALARPVLALALGLAATAAFVLWLRGRLGR